MVPHVQEVLQGQQLLELLPIEVLETELVTQVLIEVLAAAREVRSLTEVPHQEQVLINRLVVEVRALEVVVAIEAPAVVLHGHLQVVPHLQVLAEVAVLVGVAVEGEIKSYIISTDIKNHIK